MAKMVFHNDTLRITKAPPPSPSLKSKVVGMVSKGSKVSVKSVKCKMLMMPSLTAVAFSLG